jgi:hypothetical protein
MGIGRRIKETDDVQMKETKPARAEITFFRKIPSTRWMILFFHRA